MCNITPNKLQQKSICALAVKAVCCLIFLHIYFHQIRHIFACFHVKLQLKHEPLKYHIPFINFWRRQVFNLFWTSSLSHFFPVMFRPLVKITLARFSPLKWDHDMFLLLLCCKYVFKTQSTTRMDSFITFYWDIKNKVCLILLFILDLVARFLFSNSVCSEFPWLRLLFMSCSKPVATRRIRKDVWNELNVLQFHIHMCIYTKNIFVFMLCMSVLLLQVSSSVETNVARSRKA